MNKTTRTILELVKVIVSAILGYCANGTIL